jgi:hypothetical protein
MKTRAEGGLEKMQARLEKPVQYSLPVGEDLVPLNSLLGKKIQLHYLGLIKCSHCGKTTKKSFNQGYCYPCFLKLAQCDSCIMSPEKCHYTAGTCREPDWAQSHCFVDHIVYLSNTSGPKVGITRSTQIPTRWIDQGAVQALPLMTVKTRQQSGLLEVLFKQHVADKTSWQAMLKGAIATQDLPLLRDKLLLLIREGLDDLQGRLASDAISLMDKASVIDIHYPVSCYPEKVKSLDFEKQPLVEGILQGIKGQYLLLDSGVINVRKFTAYQVRFSTE